uniref:Helicase-associated domain-containing protein n=1 Tax=Anopheles funestus TaxID=62324 RepID=A0A1Y9HE05_ANOFN
MDLDELKVLRAIVEYVRISENILVLNVVREINPDVVKVLQQGLPRDRMLRTIWIVPSENDIGITIIRAESCSDGQFSVKTEGQLRNVLVCLPNVFFCNVRPNARRVVAPVNWNFWSIVKNTADEIHIPPACVYDAVDLRRREKLSANWYFRNLMVRFSVTEAKVFIVHGNADSGKRTEIVHYLLELAQQEQHSCRMIYVMEEEVEVLASVVRICEERNEPIGKTIGYKLNINGQVGEMNNVVFCTTQTLIFSMFSKRFKTTLRKLTHLIVDCGDRHPNEMNLLLSLVKKILQNNDSINLVLLSSRDDESSSFSGLFANVLELRIPYSEPYIRNLPNKPFGVEYYYLEDILEKICTHQVIQCIKQALPTTDNALKLMAELQLKYGHYSYNRNVTVIMDMLIERCWFADDAEPFTAVLLPFLEYNKHMVDYQHSNTRLSALMIAGAKGFIDVVKSLLIMGANPYIVGRKSLQAMDWCCAGSENVCWQMMQTAHHAYNNPASKKSLLCQIYHKVCNPFIVDPGLVGEIVEHICKNYLPGNVLVMLPDFCDVLECYDLLRASDVRKEKKRVHFVVCNQWLTEEELKDNILSSTRDCSELYVVILVAEPLLELVLSLSCIDYVVDTGLAVHRSGDYAKGICIDRSCLATAQRSRLLMWLAQRKCFMLYAKNHLNGTNSKPRTRAAPNMAQSGEVLKALVCRTKHSGTALEYVCSTLFSTCSKSIEGSLQTLMLIGAIEKPLSLPTNLGLLLVQLDVGVHLGKALLYSILFRCLDPMLTIVAALKVGDPFIEPLDMDGEMEIMHFKHSLHSRTYSDYMVLLRLYQQWSQYKTKQTDQKPLPSYHLKTGVMEAISNTRVELMSLLRLHGIVKCGYGHNTEQLNLNADSFPMVKGCLAAGFFPQVALADYNKMQLVASCGTVRFKTHPLSVVQMDTLPTKWVIYNRKQDHMLIVPENTKDAEVQIMDNTPISEVMFLLMCGIDRKDKLDTGNLQVREQANGKETVQFLIDQKYMFELPQEMFDAVSLIRRTLGHLFRDFTLNLLQTMERKETEALVNAVKEVLNAEESSVFPTTTIVDTRPRIKSLLPMGAFWNYTFDVHARK